jgi:hypothetical protein
VVSLVLTLAAGCGRSQPLPADSKGPTITGVVKDEAGRPLADWPVQGCTTRTCLTTTSDQNGRFSILGLDPPAEVAVKTPENAAITPMRAESIAPVVLDRAGVDAGDADMCLPCHAATAR